MSASGCCQWELGHSPQTATVRRLRLAPLGCRAGIRAASISGSAKPRGDGRAAGAGFHSPTAPDRAGGVAVTGIAMVTVSLSPGPGPKWPAPIKGSDPGRRR